MMDNKLPSEAQRKALCELFSLAFIEMRAIGTANRGRQVSELAEIFHEIPREMWGWGGWNPAFFRKRLEEYQRRYHGHGYEGRCDYLVFFDRIFPPDQQAGW